MPLPGLSAPSSSVLPVSSLTALSTSTMLVPRSSAPYLFASFMPVDVFGLSPLLFPRFVC